MRAVHLRGSICVHAGQTPGAPTHTAPALLVATKQDSFQPRAGRQMQRRQEQVHWQGQRTCPALCTCRSCCSETDGLAFFDSRITWFGRSGPACTRTHRRGGRPSCAHVWPRPAHLILHTTATVLSDRLPDQERYPLSGSWGGSMGLGKHVQRSERSRHGLLVYRIAGSRPDRRARSVQRWS